MSVEYVGQSYAPTTDAVLLSGSKDDYVMIGKAELRAPDGYTSHEIKEKLLSKARDVGADAVEILDAKREKTGSYMSGSSGSPGFESENPWQSNLWGAGGKRSYTDSFGRTGVDEEPVKDTYELLVRAYFLRLKSKMEKKTETTKP